MWTSIIMLKSQIFFSPLQVPPEESVVLTKPSRAPIIRSTLSDPNPGSDSVEQGKEDFRRIAN